jgi:hypothetical protein
MPYHCPECGATYNTDETCEDRFNASQAQELADPAYYAVHHVSVPCFMLQHNRYLHPHALQPPGVGGQATQWSLQGACARAASALY